MLNQEGSKDILAGVEGWLKNADFSIGYLDPNEFIKTSAEDPTQVLDTADIKPEEVEEAVNNAVPETIPVVSEEVKEPKPTTVPPFYSRLERTIQQKMKGPMPADQLMGMLRGSMVRQEELDWYGMGKFLSENPRPTKEQVLEHLNGNHLEVGEVVKRESNDLGQEKERPKFTPYQLKGGSNYRELLLTLPTLSNEVPIRKQKIYTIFDEKGVGVRTGLTPLSPSTLAFITKHPTYRVEYGEENNPNDERADVATYRSPHWDEPNVLAHVRVNDREVNGKDMLFVEEVQSDLHQQGRDTGYRSGEGKHIEVFEKGTERVVAVFSTGKEAEAYIKEHDPKMDKLEYADVSQDTSRVPDAPLKKSWHEYALKRLLKMAVEEGYDSIGWTTGTQQTERYPSELRKVVDIISWGRGEDGSKFVGGTMKGRRVFVAGVDEKGVVTACEQDAFIGHNLSDVIGKPMAVKAMSSDSGSIEGKDFTVGGEGMKKLYDHDIPKFLQNLTGKWGGKVETDNIDTDKGKTSVFSMDITPAMKKAILGEGFSTFGAKISAQRQIYHGTDRGLNPIFEPTHEAENTTTLGDVGTIRHGIFFSGSRDFAAQYGKDVLVYEDNFHNPAVVTEDLKMDFIEALPWADRGIAVRARYARKDWLFFEGELGQRFVAWLKNQGYDGAIFEDSLPVGDGDIEGTTYVAFYPEQLVRVSSSKTAGENYIKPETPYYHATHNEFDAFDPKFIGTQTDKGDVGSAFYFDANKDFTSSYGPITKEVRLDVNSTYVIGDEYLAECSRIEKSCSRGEKDIAPNKVILDLVGVIRRFKSDFYIDLTPKWGGVGPTIYDVVRKVGNREFANIMQKAGYDSIYWLGEVAVFDAGKIKVVGASTLKEIYHGTDQDFEDFDLDKTADGTVWFTDNPNKITGGEVAASGKGVVVSRFINEGTLKLGGWDENDKFSVGELIAQGYDGVKLEGDGETTYRIFYPEKLSKVAFLIEGVVKDGAYRGYRPDWLDEFEENGHTVFPDGTIQVYHGTTKEAANKILQEGVLRSPKGTPSNYGVHFSTSRDISENYGDGTVVALRVPIRDLQYEDVFLNGRMDFSANTVGNAYRPKLVSMASGTVPKPNSPNYADELESYIESRYEAGAPQSELDELETLHAPLVTDEDQQMTEDWPGDWEGGETEAGPRGMSEDVNESCLKEYLAHTYREYVVDGFGGAFDSSKDMADNMRGELENSNHGKLPDWVTDEYILELAKSLYEQRKGLIGRYRDKQGGVKSAMLRMLVAATDEENQITALNVFRRRFQKAQEAHPTTDFFNEAQVLTDIKRYQLEFKRGNQAIAASITDYPDLTKLHEAMVSFENKEEGQAAFEDAVVRGTELIDSEGPYKTYKCTTPPAVCEISKGSGWCTKGLSRATSYLEQGVFYAIHKRGVPLLAIHESGYWTNEDANLKSSLGIGYDRFEAGDVPYIDKILSELGEPLLVDLSTSDNLLNALKGKDVGVDDILDACERLGRDERVELYLLRGSRVRMLVEYAIRVVGGPWVEAEPTIANEGTGSEICWYMEQFKVTPPLLVKSLLNSKSCPVLVEFAKAFNKGKHWKELEDILLAEGSNQHLVDYAGGVLDDRWPAIEDRLLAEKSGYRLGEYTRFCMKARWPEAEEAVLSTRNEDEIYLYGSKAFVNMNGAVGEAFIEKGKAAGWVSAALTKTKKRSKLSPPSSSITEGRFMVAPDDRYWNIDPMEHDGWCLKFLGARAEVAERNGWVRVAVNSATYAGEPLGTYFSAKGDSDLRNPIFDEFAKLDNVGRIYVETGSRLAELDTRTYKKSGLSLIDFAQMVREEEEFWKTHAGLKRLVAATDVENQQIALNIFRSRFEKSKSNEADFDYTPWNSDEVLTDIKRWQFERRRGNTNILKSVTDYYTAAALHADMEQYKIPEEYQLEYEDRVVSGTVLIDSKGPYKTYKCDTVAAVCEMAKGTQWCVKGIKNAEIYLAKGDFVFILKNGTPLIALHESGYWEPQDSNVHPEYGVGNLGILFLRVDISYINSILTKLNKPLMPFSSKNYQTLVPKDLTAATIINLFMWGNYEEGINRCMLGRRRLPELEKWLLSEGSRFKALLLYAGKMKRGNWPEAEKLLLHEGDPSELLGYALCVLKRRWPEAESTIAARGNAWCVEQYGAWVIKGEEGAEWASAIKKSRGLGVGANLRILVAATNEFNKNATSLIGEPSMPSKGKPTWTGVDFQDEPAGSKPRATQVRDQWGGYKQGEPDNDPEMDIYVPTNEADAYGRAQGDDMIESRGLNFGMPDSRTVKYNAPDSSQSAQTSGLYTRGLRVLGALTSASVQDYTIIRKQAKDAKRDYGCLMVYLEGGIKDKVSVVCKAVGKDDVYNDESGKYGIEDKPHITVKYGFHTDDSKDFKEVISDFGEVKVKFGDLSFFDTSEEYDVLKVEVISEDLAKLNKLVGKLPNSDEHPVYKPHMTIAYLKKGCQDRYKMGSEWAKLNFAGVKAQSATFSKAVFSSADSVKTDISLVVD